ncbi:hypothetical protein SAMN05421770_1194 [Granulicella rosea]|uniref:Uncharacterized protein n=1 Tax=Granulicella rosea TaxID=474952 RepID=A0A239MNN7_9BACT|nr:hypothetical protein SAMN05421770_1194 [Granulicella rosea]
MGQLSGLAGIIKGGMAKSDENEASDFKGTVASSSPRVSGRPSLTKAQEISPRIQNRLVTKSKNPAWKAYSLFLKKETHSEMNFILRRLDSGEDMSDLVQRLVEGWVSANR